MKHYMMGFLIVTGAAQARPITGPALFWGVSEEPGVPIREAKFTAKIEKFSFSMEPDYEWNSEVVCVTTGTFVVYKGPVENKNTYNRASCDSTLDGKPVKVVIPGGIGIGKGEFAGKESLLKGLVTGLYIKDSNDEQVTSLDAIEISLSRDVLTTSLTALVSPMTFNETWSEHPSLSEYFTAEIDVEDTP